MSLAAASRREGATTYETKHYDTGTAKGFTGGTAFESGRIGGDNRHF